MFSVCVKKAYAKSFGCYELLISGDSTDSEMFSFWIKKLEILTWVEKIEIIDYSDLTNHISSFSIKITMKND